MKATNRTAEAFSFMKAVTSLLDTLRMVLALATTSTYSVMVSSKRGRYTLKMEGKETEAQDTIQMALRSNMASD